VRELLLSLARRLLTGQYALCGHVRDQFFEHEGGWHTGRLAQVGTARVSTRAGGPGSTHHLPTRWRASVCSCDRASPAIVHPCQGGAKGASQGSGRAGTRERRAHRLPRHAIDCTGHLGHWVDHCRHVSSSLLWVCEASWVNLREPPAGSITVVICGGAMFGTRRARIRTIPLSQPLPARVNMVVDARMWTVDVCQSVFHLTAMPPGLQSRRRSKEERVSRRWGWCGRSYRAYPVQHITQHGCRVEPLQTGRCSR
jgi:hypothetical protein